MLDGTPFDGDALWLALGEQAGLLTHAVRAELIEDRAGTGDFDAIRLACGACTTAGRTSFGDLEAVRPTVSGGALEDSTATPWTVHPGALYAVRSGASGTTDDTLVPQPVHLRWKGCAATRPAPTRMGDIHSPSTKRPLGVQLRPVRLRRPAGARNSTSRTHLPTRAAPSARRHHRGARLGLEQQGRLLLLRPLLLHPGDAAAERWGHPSARVDPPLFPDDTHRRNPKPCTWTVYKTIDAIPTDTYTRIGRTKPPTS